MKKSSREPLAHSEPIRKKRPMSPPLAADMKKETPRPPQTSGSGSVRVFRPPEPVRATLPDDAIGPRKLIRTTLEEVRRRQAEGKLKLSEKATSSPIRGQHAPDQTSAEFLYLTEIAERKTPVVVKLMNGDVVQGWIEYIDRNFIRLTRDGAANLFIYKHEIKYVEEVKAPATETQT